MNEWLWVLMGILLVILFLLLWKIYLLRKSAREIREAFAERLVTDTNTLIGISGRDRYMRDLANDINVQLRVLRRERQRYQQGDAELKNAVTNISHDLRTPLTAICGYLELLEREEKSPEVSRYLDIIQDRAEALKLLTEELFRYSIVLSAEEKPELEPVTVNSILEESVAAAYALLRERQIEPDIRIAEEPVVRCLNASALRRVFSNLLNNAVKYSDGDLEITLSKEGEIVFCNHASGLDQVQVGRLFDRFYTVEAARSSTGLGLSIARTLVEQMGGAITAEYTAGKLCIRILFLKSNTPLQATGHQNAGSR